MTWKLLAGAALITGVAASSLGWLTRSPMNADVREQPSHDTLVSAVDMQVSRAAHTATTLSDSRVLVAGGFIERESSKGAEVYQPGTGRFAPLPPMVTARHSHTATLLPEGQVLITGGADNQDDLGVYNSTELFDPKTGMFVAGPAMKLGRYKHKSSSVLLPSGLLLISGGAPQAETYDAASRSFALVPGEPRMAGQFSAVALLRGGGVLITGGYGNGTGPRSSAWLYRP